MTNLGFLVKANKLVRQDTSDLSRCCLANAKTKNDSFNTP